MTTIDERLAEVDRRIDDLEAGMGPRRSDQRQSVRRHVDALRQEQANAQAAARHTPDPVGERLSRLRSRLEVAERSIDADLAQDRRAIRLRWRQKLGAGRVCRAAAGHRRC